MSAVSAEFDSERDRDSPWKNDVKESTTYGDVNGSAITTDTTTPALTYCNVHVSLACEPSCESDQGDVGQRGHAAVEHLRRPNLRTKIS